jgi:hypothetical protein
MKFNGMASSLFGFFKHGRHSATVDASLRMESETYETHFPELLAKFGGKFVVIAEKEILGIADDYSSGLRLGYTHCGITKPFLVQQIQPKEYSKTGSILLYKLQCVS